jgi:hypothetical protein
MFATNTVVTPQHSIDRKYNIILKMKTYLTEASAAVREITFFAIASDISSTSVRSAFISASRFVCAPFGDYSENGEMPDLSSFYGARRLRAIPRMYIFIDPISSFAPRQRRLRLYSVGVVLPYVGDVLVVVTPSRERRVAVDKGVHVVSVHEKSPTWALSCHRRPRSSPRTQLRVFLIKNVIHAVKFAISSKSNTERSKKKPFNY